MAQLERPIRVLVVDDEAPARQRLVDLLQKDPQVESILEAPNGKAAVEIPPDCCQSTHRDALRPALIGDRPSNKWEFSNPPFNGQSAAKWALSPLSQVSQRYGWPHALSTPPGTIRHSGGKLAPPGSQTVPQSGDLAVYHWRRSTLPFRDFMILTDFSRCQGGSIGRVSRGFKLPPAAPAIWL